MTLLVGIRCEDGVVVAADQAVTFGSGQSFTISHKACKLSVIRDSIIIAGTGEVGAKQRFCETAERAWPQIAGQGKSPLDMCRALAAEGIKDFMSTNMPVGKFGALVGFPNTKKGAQLCEFSVSNFQPELKDSGAWFVSMGSGQQIADSYLAFMREVFWGKNMPTLTHGMFAAAWVMRQSIRVAPGFIAEPIDIAVLQKDKARMLKEEELRYHLDIADAATQHFGTFDPTDLPTAAKDAAEAESAPPIPEPTKA